MDRRPHGPGAASGVSGHPRGCHCSLAYKYTPSLEILGFGDLGFRVLGVMV